MSDVIEECKEFLWDNKVVFNQMIRCFNYWNELNDDEKIKVTDAYMAGKFDGAGGWY